MTSDPYAGFSTESGAEQVQRYVKFLGMYSADEVLELLILVLELDRDDDEDDELLDLELELDKLLSDDCSITQHNPSSPPH